MTTTAWARDGVNAVLGDDSWVARFGVAPGANADEDLRVRVHLEHVEAVLRARTTNGPAHASRRRMLDHLHAYIDRGEYPRNFDVKGRRPHFIDDEGRICAVGYLVEQTAGRAVAEAINVRHEWDFIPQITGIEAWVAASGLTRDELAMIQPSYGWRERPVPAPRPPPPLEDEPTVQRRLLTRALGSARGDIEWCAARHESWGERVSVSLSYVRRRLDVSVSNAGGTGFRRCVERAARTAIGALDIRGALYPVSLSQRFAINVRRDRGRFARPPRG